MWMKNVGRCLLFIRYLASRSITVDISHSTQSLWKNLEKAQSYQSSKQLIETIILRNTGEIFGKKLVPGEVWFIHTTGSSFNNFFRCCLFTDQPWASGCALMWHDPVEAGANRGVCCLGWLIKRDSALLVSLTCAHFHHQFPMAAARGIDRTCKTSAKITIL
jgi:hypothetical protein